MTDFEALIIGTGFGGAVNACRLAKRWPNEVLVLERGRRYPKGGFARTPRQMAENFWNVNGERSGVPRYVKNQQRGLFDVRSFKRLDAIVAAGLGGGSLIYANVIMEPPDEVFDQPRWPESCRRPRLSPYYDIVRSVLGARPVPQDQPEREISRTAVFELAARSIGRRSEPVDVAVFFGNDPEHPTPMGREEVNRFGALQTSCTYCAECDIGCNEHAKNTLDLNYLHVAEHRYGAKIKTDSVVEDIIPLGRDGEADIAADGSFGFIVGFHDLEGRRRETVTTKRVVVSAGTLGSTELLLRCRDVNGSLPRLSQQLGRSFSGNGDFISFVAGTTAEANPLHGPVITQRIDCNLFEDHDPERAFILEDAGMPPLAAWMVEGAKPRVMSLRSLARTVRHVAGRYFVGRSGGRMGYAIRDLMDDDVSGHSALLLCMGIDNADGRLSLSDKGWLKADWPRRANRRLYKAIVQTGKRFSNAVDGHTFMTLPTWWLPFRRNITVHALGGCVLAVDESRGVVSADPDSFGEVFGYRNLSVADGAIVPAAVGANPSATIAALSEMVAHRITGIAPDADL